MATLRKSRRGGAYLDEAQAALVKGMLLRGDRQHDIAAWFGVNGGRIAEVSTGAEFAWVVAAPSGDLPPPGPYFPATLLAQIATLEAALAARS